MALVGVLVCAGVGLLGGTLGLLRREVAQRTGRPARGGTVIDGDAVERYVVVLRALSDRPGPAPERGSITLDDLPGLDLARVGDAEALKTAEPLLALLRDGLRCERCDWQLDPATDRLDAVAVMRAAELLRVAAELGADDAIVARGCLDVVAFGADVARFDAPTGARVRQVGLEALDRVLRADGLSTEQRAEVAGALRDR